MKTFHINSKGSSKLTSFIEEQGLKQDDSNPDLIVLNTFSDMPAPLLKANAPVDLAMINSVYYDMASKIFFAKLYRKPLVVVGGGFHLYHHLLGGAVVEKKLSGPKKLVGLIEPYDKLKIITTHKYQVEGENAEFYYEEVIISEDGRTELVMDLEKKVFGVNFHPEVYRETEEFFVDYLKEFLEDL